MSILLDVFFGRLFLYVSPLCPIVGPYFWYPSMILKIYYYVLVHTRFAKAVAQIFMVLNRMTCVLVPTFYTRIWNKLMPIAVGMILLVPFGGTWYLLLTPRYFVIPSYGGFAVIYIRAVDWAAVSLFQSIYYLTALGFTVICTTITLYSLILLRVRVKSAEKSLCFTSMFISFIFLLVAATQSLTLLLWDIFFNRLTAFIPPLCPILSPLFIMPSYFLKFYYCSYNHARMSKSVAQIMMVLNRMCCVMWPMSYEKVWNKFAAPTVILILIVPFGGTWNMLLARMYLFPSYGGFAVTYVKTVQWLVFVVCVNCQFTFSVIFQFLAFDLLTVGRLAAFTPPLCKVLTPLFYEPSFFLKLYYCSYNQARMAKSVAQILMVLNRMCCVMWPMSYEKVWNKFPTFTVVLILIIPFGGTWNLYLGRMYTFPSYGGFSVTYFRYVEWVL
ncbi:hypothetical protein B9Z55_006935 [Caenorhabditis nigoni]|uniref:Serpentine receptor class gamma n=1 Tax=Caenorhabditis nigoni TaxID=1611254 RepID=A0A2G5V7G4_9PELO|nr:hypothetical protein B9Z55_006935 [Caenorhabditis nigoni]